MIHCLYIFHQFQFINKFSRQFYFRFFFSLGACSGACSRSFIGNNLLLKLIRTFFLALNNNPKLFKKDFLSSVFVPLSKLFNSLMQLLCLLSAPSIDKSPSCISLKRQ